MILKKNEFFLLIFLILLQSCSGGRIGNFLESSFNDLEKISQNEDLQKNLGNKQLVVKENKKIDQKKNKKIKKVEKPKNVIENKKDIDLETENKEIDQKKNKKIKKVEKPKNNLENKNDINLENISKQKNNKIKNSSRKRKIELQSYKIIFILKDIDPKDLTEELSSILSNSEVNFEIEKIERILDSKNKSINKN
ncbi:hypothetical protein [Prochlorococcus marinus]|uniref:hypothetical protein n=1 Tax=Prochlorococcus marinus TaxID=1219 RepID=UPI001ADA077E|nr:hypothetical protein [Prochlorococcus marinus]MBO8204013.1 hypothetical protein [Prochlorococcus marinus CUG1415]MBW3043313.1 hypothetical protein [Prochlorococcus marinus str. MU1415]